MNRALINAIYSFVVDSDPKFENQARLFLSSLLSTGVSPAQIVAHFTPGASPEARRIVESYGIQPTPLTPFLDGKYCNKLVQLDALLSRQASFYILCDTDLAFAEGIEPLLDSHHVRAKPADLANPPIEKLEQLAVLIGVSGPRRIVKTTCSEAETWSVNCNGGLYIIPDRVASSLSKRWKHFAIQLASFPEALEQWKIHIDQISFAMAMVEMGLDIEEVPIEYNFPLHLAGQLDKVTFSQPKVLHYHWLQNSAGGLDSVGHPAIDSAVLAVNTHLSRSPRATRPGPKCWGIGLGRTGTNSLCAALKVLGYRSVAHNPPFEELRDLDGGADNGVTIFYKYLDYKFPGSRFVFMQRDLDSWLDSMEYANSIFPVTSREDDIPIMRRMALYETVTFDRKKYIAAYHKHEADVMRYFAGRDDLLIINIVKGEGWEKLCPFLGLDHPREPFPHAHRRSGNCS